MKKLLSWFLIIFPLVSTLYIYYPILKTELNYRVNAGRQVVLAPKSHEFGVVIPSLGVNELVIPNVDAFNKAEYMQALYKGVAHAKNSVPPDQDGTTYLFAHSSDNPFSITRYNTSFYLLPKLAVGDEILLYYQNKEYTYRVSHLEVVKPYQVKALTESTENQLILQTCTPVGTSLNRLLVFAEPI